MPQLPRRLQKRAIGQQQRTRCIVGQTDPAHVARGGNVEGGAVQFVLDQVFEPQANQLMRHLEGAGGARQAGVDIEDARARIEAPHGAAPLTRGDAHAAQVVEGGLQLALRMDAVAEVQPRGQILGRPVQGVDVVVAIVEEVAHRLIGQGGRGVGGVFVAAQRLVQRLQPLVQTAIVLVQGQELPRQPGRVHGRLLQLARRGRLGVARDVGGRLAQVGDQAGVAVQIEQAGVHVEGARQGDQHPCGGRALVGLDLRQIGRRQRQPPGALLQRPAARLAQLADLGPEVEFFSHDGRALQLCKNACLPWQAYALGGLLQSCDCLFAMKRLVGP